jgi:heptosyltransferase-3
MKILIIRPAALGDTLMLMPSLRALRQGVETTLVGRRPGIDFLAPYVHRAMDYESQGWHTLFMDQEETVSSISLPSADLAALFHADPDGRIAARLQRLLPGARLRVFPGFPPADEETHVALYLAGCLETSGCPIKPEQAFEAALRFPLIKRSASEKLGERVVFHPGSGGRRKNLPPRFWLDFIRCFRESSSLPLTLLLGPAEEELLSFFRARLQRTETDVLFCPEKESLMSLLSQSRLYAGHDSGITHLAAMLGAPTLAFFTSTSVIQWRPLGPKVRIIQGDGCGPDVLDEAMTHMRDLIEDGVAIS